MTVDESSEERARRRSGWLAKLAEAEQVVAAAEALFAIETDGGAPCERSEQDEDKGEDERTASEAHKRKEYAAALALLGESLERLIPAWVDRFLERVVKLRECRSASMRPSKRGMTIRSRILRAWWRSCSWRRYCRRRGSGSIRTWSRSLGRWGPPGGMRMSTCAPHWSVRGRRWAGPCRACSGFCAIAGCGAGLRVATRVLRSEWTD